MLGQRDELRINLLLQLLVPVSLEFYHRQFDYGSKLGIEVAEASEMA